MYYNDVLAWQRDAWVQLCDPRVVPFSDFAPENVCKYRAGEFQLMLVDARYVVRCHYRAYRFRHVHGWRRQRRGPFRVQRRVGPLFRDDT